MRATCLLLPLAVAACGRDASGPVGSSRAGNGSQSDVARRGKEDTQASQTANGDAAGSSTAGGAAQDAGARTDCQHVTVRRDCADGWCKIPGGCFVVGSPEAEWGRAANSETETSITLTHGFLMSQHGRVGSRGFSQPEWAREQHVQLPRR